EPVQVLGGLLLDVVGAQQGDQADRQQHPRPHVSPPHERVLPTTPGTAARPAAPPRPTRRPPARPPGARGRTPPVRRGRPCRGPTGGLPTCYPGGGPL